MSVDNPAVSGSETSNAGDKTDPLDSAFQAAFESVDIEDDKVFVAEAKPAKAKTEPKQVDKPATEDAAPAEPGGEDADDSETEGEPEKVATEPEVAAPAHWDAAKREAFGKLPNDARKVVLDLAKGFEGDFTRKSMELADDRKLAQGIRSLITPLERQQLQNNGLTEIDGVRRLVELNQLYSRDPANYVRFVIQSANLDPRQIFPDLAGDGQPGQQPAPADPQYQQLTQTIQNLTGKVTAFERQQQDAEIRTAERAINRFRDAKDESGQVLHPHFQRVEQHLNWILTSNPEVRAIDDLTERLQKAYDLAVFADPEIKSQVFEGEVAKRTAEAARKAEVNKAKRAQAPIKSAPMGSPPSKPKTPDEAVRAAMANLGVA